MKRYYEEWKGRKDLEQYIPKFEAEINEKLDEFFQITLNEDITYKEALEWIHIEKAYVQEYIEILKSD